MKEFENELWNYIDGSCSVEERLRVEGRLATDREYEAVYHDLLSMHNALEGLELEQPSMSFTRKVMEQIKYEPMPAAVLIDKRLIYGIGAFFGLLFFGVLATFIFSVNWSEQATNLTFDIAIPPGLYKSMLNGKYLTVFYIVDVVLALYVLDGFLRKRLLAKKLYK